MISDPAKPVSSSTSVAPRPVVGFRIPRFRFEVRLTGLLLLLVFPALLIAGIMLFSMPGSFVLRLGAWIALAVVLAWLGSAVFRHIVRPLQTLSNVVAALRENEYSFRAREVGAGDALGDLAAQINELARDLRTRRHRESETFALLERVVETMDLPVFAFDASSSLQLINPAAMKLLNAPSESLLHRSAASLRLGEALVCPDNSIVAISMHAREGQWMVRRSKFYQNGMPHTLLLLSDVSGVLREQERRAWQRLIRVLAHEVNNSLTPIKSIAGSLRARIQHIGNHAKYAGKDPSTSRMQEKASMNTVDLEHGLAIIEERAESLNRFLQAYTQLAKLPPPQKAKVSIGPLLARVCNLETRLKVAHFNEEIDVFADAAQLEQALINLIRNAVDAALQFASERYPADVSVTCRSKDQRICFLVEDNGPGVANPANLFIPFYTTKPGGTGIGLVLARQIIEAHGGTLTLTNRENVRGCCATILIPENLEIA